MSADKNDKTATTSFERREFIKRAAVGAGAVAMGMVAMGCSSSSGSSSTPLPATSVGAAATLPSSSAWQFAVMSDTQWLTADTDHLNPNTSAIGIITQLNQQFIAQNVKFVVQVGDLADQASGNSNEAGYATTASLCEDTRALFVQTLFNHGIGFFACRGNHDDGSAAEFVKLFPQTQTGQMNATPASAFSNVSAAYPAADASAQPIPSVSGSAFTQGSHFSTIGSPSANLLGLSYGFDFNNARLLFIDQFTTLDKLNPDEVTPYALGTTASQQQTWINTALAGKPSGGHAFVFTHKGLITQQHIDTLFGDCPADANFAAAANAGNGARLFFCGHDHNHSRSLVKTTDSGAAAQITHVLCQSVSSKFYTPNEFNAFGNSNVPSCTSNDAYFCAGKRQTMLSQELYTVGYYIVTVDGPNVTVDYYSAPAYPTYSAPTENMVLTTPTLNFTKRETFGYSQIGKEFLVGNGGAFTVVQDAGPSGTTAAILSGTNSNPNTDASGRKYFNDVTTGWYAESTQTASDVLVLWGMGHTLGSSQTDVYTLSMSYDATKGSSFVLATPDANGNWAKAVDQNLGGATKAVTGPWKSSYALGTYGMDPATKTVWAVLNFNGCFAAIAGA